MNLSQTYFDFIAHVQDFLNVRSLLKGEIVVESFVLAIFDVQSCAFNRTIERTLVIDPVFVKLLNNFFRTILLVIFVDSSVYWIEWQFFFEFFFSWIWIFTLTLLSFSTSFDDCVNDDVKFPNVGIPVNLSKQKTL